LRSGIGASCGTPTRIPGQAPVARNVSGCVATKVAARRLRRHHLCGGIRWCGHRGRRDELKRQMDSVLNSAVAVPAGLQVEYFPVIKRRYWSRRWNGSEQCGGRFLPFSIASGGPDVPLDLARRIGTAPSSEVLATFGTIFPYPLLPGRGSPGRW
jgi:hypothetical protein